MLFFEPPAPCAPRRREGRKVRPGLTVYTLPPVPNVDERHSLLFHFGRKKLSRFISDRMERHRFRQASLWITSPEQVHLLDLLPSRGIIYDCDRYWSDFPPEWESDLALAADVIFAASEGLADHLSPCNDNIALLPNGVNYPMFSRDCPDRPAELRTLHGKILGWTGTLRRSLDLSPLLQTAADLPECTFVLVGQAEQGPQLRALSAFPNVILIGPKSPVDLPDYLSRFDVCLNLLPRSGPESDVIPCRIFEYLSTGKPLVSMIDADQVEHFPDVIYGAHTIQEFSQLCASALTEAGDWARRRRMEYGAAAAWSARADEVHRILSTIGL